MLIDGFPDLAAKQTLLSFSLEIQNISLSWKCESVKKLLPLWGEEIIWNLQQKRVLTMKVVFYLLLFSYLAEKLGNNCHLFVFWKQPLVLIWFHVDSVAKTFFDLQCCASREDWSQLFPTIWQVKIIINLTFHTCQSKIIAFTHLQGAARVDQIKQINFWANQINVNRVECWILILIL